MTPEGECPKHMQFFAKICPNGHLAFTPIFVGLVVECRRIIQDQKKKS